MAGLRPVNETHTNKDNSSKLDLLAGSTFQYLQAMEELSDKGIESELELAKLRLSNVAQLGLLRKKQEEEVLQAALKANNKFIEQQTEARKQEAIDEINHRIKTEIDANKTLSKKEKAQRKKELQEELKLRLKNLELEKEWRKKNKKKEIKEEAAEAKRNLTKQSKEYQTKQVENLFGKGKDITQRVAAFKNLTSGIGVKNKDGTITGINSKAGQLGAGLASLTSALSGALSNFAKQLETQMDEIASKKSTIDTRLQGSSNDKRMGSYWDQMTADITGIAGVSPLIKQSSLANRISEMVGQGIAFNVEQRAVLQELSGKIATTFNAANGTLLRLVKIQQQDTTAGRLGMESALTAFLNNMYETTEYMQGLATSVKSSLEEAMSLMSGENALSFEYQVQKWLGSLSSVGMSDSAVQGLAGTLGKLASGQIDAITAGGQGNLVIMAANNAGLSISELLAEGLDQTTTNTLLNSMVDYLAKIYHESGNSKVIQQQIASVYGITASDLKAAVNLSKSTNVVAKDGLDYESAMNRLYSMADSMYTRTSIGEMMTNMWENVKYSLSAGMVNNPITYALYKASGLLKDTTGGIDFGIPLVMGNGMPIKFNVADLMRTGALAGGAISSMAQMIGGMGGGGITGRGILNAAGVSNRVSLVTRGSGTGLSTMGGATVSESGSYAANADSSDVTNKTMTDQTDSSNAEVASAVESTDTVQLQDVDAHVVNILEILKEVSSGNSILKVTVENEVRTKESSSSGSGVAGL